MIYYAGVGARKTPTKVLQRMFFLGKILAKLGFILRSGGAHGADAAFEDGCDYANGKKEIYLPWQGYNNNYSSNLYAIEDKVFTIAADIYGPRWHTIKPGVQRLMARNIHQVLGETLDNPSLFLVCWTPDGAEDESERSQTTGGTGQAIACASRFGVPVFNLKRVGSEDDLLDYITENYNEFTQENT